MRLREHLSSGNLDDDDNEATLMLVTGSVYGPNGLNKGSNERY